MASQNIVGREATEHSVQMVLSDAASIPSASNPVSYPKSCCSTVLFYLMWSCLFIMLPLLAGTGVVLILLCSPLMSLAIIVILLIAVTVTRVIQFIRWGQAYDDQLVQIKHLLRAWLFCLPFGVLFVLWFFFYVLAKYVPDLNQVMILELLLTKWVELISLLGGLLLLSGFVYFLAHHASAWAFRGRDTLVIRMGQACSEIADDLVFWLAAHEVQKRVPALKHHQLLGLSTQHWIKVFVLVLVGYNLIILFTHLFVLLLDKTFQGVRLSANDDVVLSAKEYVSKKFLQVRYLVYYAEGIEMSISFVMGSLLLLLVWIFYFGTHLNLNTNAITVWEYGKWTLVSLFIFSCIWLIKTWVLLAREARTVYDRLQPRILSTCEQLFFLTMLNPIFWERNANSPSYKVFEDPVLARFTDLNYGFRTTEEERKAREKDLLFPEDTYPLLNHLQKGARYFELAKQDLLKETFIPEILEKFNKIGDNREILFNLILGEEVFDGIQLHPATRSSTDNQVLGRFGKMLMKTHNQDNSFDQVYFNEIQTWVERAHNQCINMSNTLSSAKEAADCLNKIISWVIIGGVFIMWLLLTGLASTKVLIIIASPLLAASFIFGNSCKTLFEGFLFVFVVHPFDVGDLCFLDDKLMEVRSTGVWTTTFTKVDKFGSAQELVTYFNTELTLKTIINYKTKFDWSDYAEFNLGPLEWSMFKTTQDDLIHLVRKDLNEDKCGFLSRSPELSTLAMEDGVKLVIRLEYKASDVTKEWTYSECLRLKDKLKGEFYLVMHHVIDTFEVKRTHPKYGRRKQLNLEK